MAPLIGMSVRARNAVIAAVLEALEKGATKTMVMYSAGLSFTAAGEYLDLLIGNGLVEHQKEEEKYRLTKMGMEALQAYRETGKIGPGLN